MHQSGLNEMFLIILLRYDPADPESYWGYVLAMGSSEGNLHALWSTHNYLNLNTVAEPVLMTSQNVNFSISKLADIVGLKLFCRTLWPTLCFDLAFAT